MSENVRDAIRDREAAKRPPPPPVIVERLVRMPKHVEEIVPAAVEDSPDADRGPDPVNGPIGDIEV